MARIRESVGLSMNPSTTESLSHRDMRRTVFNSVPAVEGGVSWESLGRFMVPLPTDSLHPSPFVRFALARIPAARAPSEMLMLRRVARIGLLLGSAWITAIASHAKDDNPEAWLAEHTTKYEYRIPMRDGVKLFTRVFVPKDDSTRYPIVLTRTPYGLKPYGTSNHGRPSASLLTLAKDKFILVTQDVRGRNASEGTFEHMRPFRPGKGPSDTDESTDAWDTIDWLVKNTRPTTAASACSASRIRASTRRWA
jgi:hypothetical protein